MYLGSADLMQRNLDRRVETLFPLEDPAMIGHVYEQLLLVYLKDNTQARILLPDGSYERAYAQDGATPIDSQAIFMNGQNIPLDEIPRLHVYQ